MYKRAFEYASTASVKFVFSIRAFPYKSSLVAVCSAVASGFSSFSFPLEDLAFDAFLVRT